MLQSMYQEFILEGYKISRITFGFVFKYQIKVDYANP